ncbi:MAG TPA: SpoIIE family protein phosphatase [Anaerolineales bacterium]|nr:SpoIIE family protein phosphatase [Anaerolineales bacterium]
MPRTDESAFLSVPLFREIPADDLVRMVNELPIETFEPGSYLFRDGDPGENLFVVKDGHLEIVLAEGSPDEMLLKICGPGEYVGEMGLILADGKRTATVRAQDRVQTWVMSRGKFTEVLHRWPFIAYAMVNILSERLDATNDATFRDLTAKNHALQKAYDELKAAQAQLVEKERLERELQVAADIQLSILPDVLPVIAGFDFGARILPARRVGGDFYDVFPIGAHEAGIVIGDVADKGVPAALFMARAHALIMAEADKGLSAGQVLNRANAHITYLQKAAQFVTALYGILDVATCEFAYARAGHEPPLLLRQDGSVERIPHDVGMSLGLWDVIQLDEQVVKFEPGSTLVLFTDGMTDCRDPNGMPFGLERIKTMLSGMAGLPAQEICDRLFNTLMSYQNGAGQDDDVTLVAIRRAT